MNIDLSQLVGGEQFLVPSIVSRNGFGIKLKALADSGANGFCFVNSTLATTVAEYLQIEKQQAARPIPVNGFDGRPSTPVTEFLTVHLLVDGRRVYNVPILIVDLGNHDMILGRIFLAHFDIWLNVRDRTLVWPDDQPRTPSFARTLVTTILTLKRPVDLEHQADMVRRDLAIESVARKEQLRPTTPPQEESIRIETPSKP